MRFHQYQLCVTINDDCIMQMSTYRARLFRKKKTALIEIDQSR